LRLRLPGGRRTVTAAVNVADADEPAMTEQK
jgi:hypothetical protein